MMSDKQVRAAALVSARLRSGDDHRLIEDLLALAAGEPVEQRDVSARQYGLLHDHRVLSLLPANWRVPTDVRPRLEAQARVAQHMLLIEDCRKTVTLLEDVGIAVRVLKGAATSQLDYHDMNQRTFGDVDLLVSHDDFEHSIQLLAESGAAPTRPGRTGYDFQQEALLIAATGNEIDLHYRLSRTSPPLLPQLFAGPVALPHGGLALPAAARLAHAASHLMLTPPGARRLSGLADISAIRSRHDVSLRDARRFARLLGCEALVGWGLRAERELRGKPVDTNHWRQPSRLELASYARSNRQMLMEHAYFFHLTSGHRDKLRYLAQWALPTRRGAAKRGGFLPYFQRALPRRLGGQNGGHEI